MSDEFDGLDSILLYNYKAIEKKLFNLKKYRNNCIRCNDFIETFSTSISRDKRIINGWDAEYLIVDKILLNGRFNKCRLFTPKGLIKYIHAGHVYCYETLCALHKTKPIDPNIQYLQRIAQIKDGEPAFKTSIILKWIFGKRKQDSQLSRFITISKLLEYLKKYVTRILPERHAALVAFNEVKREDRPADTSD